MICINRNILRILGMTAEAIRAIADRSYEGGDGQGLATSALFSFGGGGNGGRDVRVLESEPTPRTLLLVGMTDPYGEAARRQASVEEVAVTADRQGSRTPTAAEARRVADLLASCEHPDAAEIRAAFVAWSTKT